MKVLQVVPGISSAYGGPSVSLVDMTRHLRAKGCDATIITTNNDPAGRLKVPLGVPVNVRGAEVIYFNVWPRGRYAFSTSLMQALLRAVRHYDIVHVHWLYNFSSLAAAAAAHRAGVPYIFQPHGSLGPHLMRKNFILKKAYITLIGRYIMQGASGIIFTAEDERRLASVEKLAVPQYIVPVGFDWKQYCNLPPKGEFRRRFPEIRDRRIVLFLGRISRQKGLDLLISAFKQLISKRPDLHLVIVGPDGEGYGRHVRRWIREAGVEDHTTFVGFIEPPFKLAAYVDSEVFVLPSYAENFGVTVAEALACKTPVVITDRVNICDEIRRAQAGVVVECSVQSLVEGMNRVLIDRCLAEHLAENGHELVQRQYSWDVVLQKTLAVYREVLDRRGQ